MIHLPYGIIIEVFFGLFLWWVGVYLFVQNPFSRLIQIIVAILAAMSFYMTSDLFMFIADNANNHQLSAEILRISSWTIYLPAPLLYHVSYLLINKDQRKKLQKIFLYVAYLSSFVVIYLESGTNLTRNYKLLDSPGFAGNYTNITGPYFWITAVFYMLVLLMTTLNFYFLLKHVPKKSRNWYKYLWPFIGLVIGFFVSPFIVLSYYNILFHPYFYDGAVGFFILGGALLYSIIKYDLLIEEAKIIFGKSFIYSSLVMLLIFVLYFATLVINGDQFTSVKSFITPFILAYLIILTHPAYDWLSTFVKDIMYNVSSGISVVKDEEVYEAIKNYDNPEKLENSSLLRLILVDQKIRKNSAKTPVDSLRMIIQEAIDYFKPTEDINRRTKKNLKYHLLKMIAFDQAEEGQILWELGFEEYPLRIMSKESQTRPPLFKASSPSDYNYVSRNAYMALKKEAIHNITWRISYLEKMSKKKI